MPAYLETWDVTKPAGSRDISLGDDDIREFKRGLTERLGTDHVFVSDETGYNTIGYHTKTTLVKQATDPNVVTDAGIFYTKDIGSGQIEAFFIDEAGNICQLTKRGSVSRLTKEVAMWFGTIATIPGGWYLCDGLGGRPDLRDKFIIPARQDAGGVAMTNVEGTLSQSASPTHNHGALTGSTALDLTQIPAHKHKTPAGQNGAGSLDGSQRWSSGATQFGVSGDSETVGGGLGHTHSISAVTSIPPYFALAFISQFNV